MIDRFAYVGNAAKFAEKFPGKVKGDGYVGPGLYNLRTGYQMDRNQSRDKDGNEILFAPQVLKAMPEYVSHCSGKRISCRSQRIEDAKRFDMVPWEPQSERNRRPEKAWVGKKLCRAQGVRQSEANLEWLKNKKQRQLTPPPLDKLMAEVAAEDKITINTNAKAKKPVARAA